MEIQKERPSYVRFVREAVEDVRASTEAGHYVARDVDMAYITPHYTKDVFKAEVRDWFVQLDADVKGERIPKEWADAYRKAYEAWQQGEELPLTGTAIKGWGVISPGQQETLIRMNIRTVEDLSMVNDEGIKRIGMGGIDLKNKAKAWLSQLQDKGPLTQEVAAVKAENRELKMSIETLTKQVEALMRDRPVVTQINPVETNVITANDIIEEPPEKLYEKKFGHPPHHRMKPETILAKLAE